MKVTNRSYEALMIFSVEGGEDNAKALSKRFLTIIEDNAETDNVEEWGRRRLAYPIQDEPDGYYLLVNFTSETEFPTELERVLSITDGVLRSLVVRADKVIPVETEETEDTQQDTAAE